MYCPYLLGAVPADTGTAVCYLLLRLKRDWTISRFQLLYYICSFYFLHIVFFSILLSWVGFTAFPRHSSYIAPNTYLGLLVASACTVLCRKQMTTHGGRGWRTVRHRDVRVHDSHKAVRVGARACSRAYLPRIRQYAWLGHYTHVSTYERATSRTVGDSSAAKFVERLLPGTHPSQIMQ